MVEPYDGSYWMPGVNATREAVGIADETIVFLHLAKSGGSTLGDAVRHSTAWEQVEFPFPAPPSPVRVPRRLFFRRRTEPWLERVDEVRRGVSPESRLFIWGGHPTFRHSCWVAEHVFPAGRHPQVMTIYRSSRQRIVSRFRDYWARATLADVPVRQALMSHNPRLAAIATDDHLSAFESDVKAFKLDSLNYVSSTGEIEGTRWFRDVFSDPGFPFLLRDVFASPSVLHEALASERLRLVPIENLDAEIERLTGAITPRIRVSPPIPDNVAQAIENSKDIIDQMVASDAPFEDVIRRFLSGSA